MPPKWISHPNGFWQIEGELKHMLLRVSREVSWRRRRRRKNG